MRQRALLGTIMVLVSSTFSACTSHTYTSQSFQQYLATHQYAVGQTTIALLDSSRNRPLITEIWYPTEDTTKVNLTTESPFKLPPTSKDAEPIAKKSPLVLLSHGTGGNRISQMWLACELASNGYVVAAVDHYGNTFDNKIPENFVKVWDRPIDISYVLDELLRTPPFVSIIDTARIGMAGFSLGGYTTIALAGAELNYEFLKEFSGTEAGKIEFDLPELGDVSPLMTPRIIELGNQEYRSLKDTRISAFVAMAPAIGQGFHDKSQVDRVDKPVLIIGAQQDDRAPVHTNARHYSELLDSSEYIELSGQVGHYIFMNEAKNPLKRNAPIVFKDHSSVDRNYLHQEVSNMVLQFFHDEFHKSSH